MTNLSESTHVWVDTDDAFEDFLDIALAEDVYFLDTEFHREKTYYPQLALVQVEVAGQVYILDPLELEMSWMVELFESDALCVLHAAQQDMDVLAQSVGAIPSRIYDTQIAASFLGYSQPSLASLLQSFLKVTVPKNDRLSDWLQRPLTDDQLSYAASDVRYLPELHRLISVRLDELGRTAWAREAFEELRTRPTGPGDVLDAWLRVKDVRTLKGRSRWVARSVAAWREGRAMALNLPPRHVLSDIAILGIAQRPPRNREEMAKVRGVDSRHLSGRHGDDLWHSVEQGLADSKAGDLHFPVSDTEEIDKSMRSAVTLVSAWITELARQSHLDTALLGTRRDIVELLSQSPAARLRQGWRADIVGNDIEDLVQGRKALTFGENGQGRALKLVEVRQTPANDAPSASSPVDYCG